MARWLSDGLLLLCVIFLLLNTTHAVPPNQPSPQNFNLIHNLIHYLYPQREPGRNQFGFVLMGEVTVDGFPLNVSPLQTPDRWGAALTDNRFAVAPPNRNQYVNYVVARPDRQLGTETIHAEQTLLGELEYLFLGYHASFGRCPNFILLYSWIMPCTDCTDLILQYQQQRQWSSFTWIVSYSTEGYNLPYMSDEINRNNRNRMNASRIIVLREPCYHDLPQLPYGRRKRSVDDSNTCSFTDTFQGCLWEQLSDYLTCCSAEADKPRAKAAFINSYTSQCFPLYTESCADTFVHNYAGSICGCIKSWKVQELLKQDSCRELPLSLPFSSSTSRFASLGIATNETQLRNFELPVNVPRINTCSSIDRYYIKYTDEGIEYDKQYLTAGMSICRQDHPCGYHGDYDYMWCYTDFNGNWEQCCAEDCRQTESDPWCYTAANHAHWAWCGEAGRMTINNKVCALDHPCGRHTDYNYLWCYTNDAHTSWDYCCLRSSGCGHNQNNPWCWTGFAANWERCARPPYYSTTRRYCKQEQQLTREQDSRVMPNEVVDRNPTHDELRH